VSVYMLLPTGQQACDYRADLDRQGQAIVKAIRGSGVQYVVVLSNMGADSSEAHDVLAGLHAQDGRLKEIDRINLLLLRPVPFFENFYASIALIRAGRNQMASRSKRSRHPNGSDA